MAEWLIESIEVFVRIVVAAVAFTVGMSATAAQVSEVLQRRGFFLRALFGVLVVVPVLAVLLVKATTLPTAVSVGLLVTAVSAGPVAALRLSDDRRTGRAVAIGLMVVVFVLNLVFVPLVVWIIGRGFGRDVYLSVGDVAKIILPLQLLPVSAGVLVAKYLPQFVARATKPLTRATNLVLGAVLVVLLVHFFKPMLAIGLHGFLAAAALPAAAVVAAHLLGGPAATDRRVLAAFMAIRYPALALALAKVTAQGREAVPTVLAYLICSVLAYSLYSALIVRSGKRADAPADSRPHPPDSRPRPHPVG